MPSGKRADVQRFGKTFWLEARREGQTPEGPLIVATVSKSIVVREIAGETTEEAPGQASSSAAEAPGPPEASSAEAAQATAAPDSAETVRREKDGGELDLSEEALIAKARGIPDMPPLHERQQHRLLHLPFRSWCK